MKKRICIILAIILLLPAGLFLYGLSLPSYYMETYYAELPELYSRLRATQGRKIVIIGGSNVAFGVNSADLETLLREHDYDYSVCNFGLYAAVGTSAMLSLSQNTLCEGDIVVLAIEPTSETFSSYFGATAMLKCAENDPGMLLCLNNEQRAQVVGNYISYLQERAEIRRTGILPQAEGVYAKASFDSRGDMICERAGNAMPLGYDTAVPISFTDLTYEEDFVEQVNDYIAYARSKGAEVVMSFSPMNRSAVTDTSDDAVYNFYLSLQDTFDCPVISDPNDYILDSGWFYDSNFHLNSAGMTVRTHQLGLDLLTWFGCSDRIAFDMPEKPGSIAVISEDETDSDAFLYEEIGTGGLKITGLTEQGLASSSLTIPSTVNGKVVAAISADAFGIDENLTELTLPESIESIPDGLFSGCPNLTRLTLLHRAQTPDVGTGLLDGTNDVTIYVTAEAYSLYRDGAGCAANNWELYLDRIFSISQ